MIKIAVTFGESRYTYVIDRSETSDVLRDMHNRYFITSLLNKFNLIVKKDRYTGFKSVLSFHKFVAKTVNRDVIFVVKNDGFKSKEIDEIVEHFKHFWD